PQEYDAVAPLSEGFAPRQAANAKPGDTAREFFFAFITRHDPHRLLGQQQRAELAALASAQARARRIKRDLFARFDTAAKARLDRGEGDRCGEQDAAGGRAAG